MYIRSPVIRKPKDWADEALLVPHEVIRSGLETLQQATSKEVFCPANSHLTTTFYTWYKTYFMAFVDHHHELEDSMFFPRLNQEKLDIEILTKEHNKIDRLIHDIVKLEKLFDSTYSDDELDDHAGQLRTAVLDLTNVLENHLNREEEQIPAILRHQFTEVEYESLVNEILSGLTLEQNRVMLPWILTVMEEWKGPAGVREFCGKMPMIVRVTNYLWWTPTYERDNRNLLKTMKKGSVTPLMCCA